MVSSDEIKLAVSSRFSGAVEVADDNFGVPAFYVNANRIIDLCGFVRDSETLSFDYLASLCAVDYSDRFEIVYHLYSLQLKHSLILKVKINRKIPAMPSVFSIWKAADWQEREIYDLFGINFDGHPDLRRILLEPDWEGFPLRKDYKE